MSIGTVDFRACDAIASARERGARVHAGAPLFTVASPSLADLRSERDKRAAFGGHSGEPRLVLVACIRTLLDFDHLDFFEDLEAVTAGREKNHIAAL